MVGQPVGFCWQNNNLGLKQDSVTAALRSSAGSSGFHEMNHPVVLARDNATHAAVVGTDLYNGAITGDVAATMGTPGSSVNASGPTVMAFAQNQLGEVRTSDVSGTINTNSNASGRNTPMAAVAFPIDTQNMTEGHSSGGLGFGQHGDPSFTVTKGHSHAVAHAFYSTGGTHGVNQHPEVSPAVKVGSGLGIPSPPAVAFTRCDNGRDASVEVTPTMRCGSNYSAHPAVAHALRGEGFDASEDGTGRGTPLVPVAPTLTAHNDPSRSPQSSEVTQQVAAVHAASMTVRRLTPRECERLQAFPDDYTLIPWRKKPAADCPDGPRYKALGNSMAVNCMAWIGERIAAIEAREQ